MKHLLIIGVLAVGLCGVADAQDATPATAQAQTTILQEGSLLPLLPLGTSGLLTVDDKRARSLLVGLDAVRFDNMMVEDRTEAREAEFQALYKQGLAEWEKYKALNKQGRTPEEEEKFQQYRRRAEANLPGLIRLDDRLRKKVDLDLAIREGGKETDPYFVVARDSAALKRLLALIANDLTENRQSAKSAAQASQLADETLVKLALLQAAQNQRVIELLEKLVAKK